MNANDICIRSALYCIRSAFKNEGDTYILSSWSASHINEALTLLLVPKESVPKHSFSSVSGTIH